MRWLAASGCIFWPSLAVAGESGGDTLLPAALKMMAALVVVLGIILVLYALSRRRPGLFSPTPGERHQGGGDPLSRAEKGPVPGGGRRREFLLGMGQERIELISRLERKPSPCPSFADTLRCPGAEPMKKSLPTGRGSGHFVSRDRLGCQRAGSLHWHQPGGRTAAGVDDAAGSVSAYRPLPGAGDPADDDRLHPGGDRPVLRAPGDGHPADAAQSGDHRPRAVSDLFHHVAGFPAGQRHRPAAVPEKPDRPGAGAGEGAAADARLHVHPGQGEGSGPADGHRQRRRAGEPGRCADAWP